MLHAVDRLCVDCGTVTIFLPLDDLTFGDAAFGDADFEDTWICTACDGAVVFGVRPRAA